MNVWDKTINLKYFNYRSKEEQEETEEDEEEEEEEEDMDDEEWTGEVSFLVTKEKFLRATLLMWTLGYLSVFPITKQSN